jgi:hypothetical protein
VIDLSGHLRTARAGGIADDRREMDNSVDTAKRGARRLLVPHVAAYELEVRRRPHRQKRITHVHQAVDDAHLVAFVEQLRQEDRPQVARAAGDEYPHRLLVRTTGKSTFACR